MQHTKETRALVTTRLCVDGRAASTLVHRPCSFVDGNATDPESEQADCAGRADQQSQDADEGSHLDDTQVEPHEVSAFRCLCLQPYAKCLCAAILLSPAEKGRHLCW